MIKLSKDRNGTNVFAARTQKNLEHIVVAAKEGGDVHPVTQAVSALLGIVVFPWETSAFDIVKKQPLPVLVQQGWPQWEMRGDKRVIRLKALIELLRNCIAHGRIEFDSDSRIPSEVHITFTHYGKKTSKPDWKGRIRGDDLIEFCKRFSHSMKAEVR